MNNLNNIQYHCPQVLDDTSVKQEEYDPCSNQPCHLNLFFARKDSCRSLRLLSEIEYSSESLFKASNNFRFSSEDSDTFVIVLSLVSFE
jgi:hypothetical protein